MDRIYQSGAASEPPTYPDEPSHGYPTLGKPAQNRSATVPGPWWFHMITAELMTILEAAGVDPAGAEVDQVLAALRELFASRASVEDLTTSFGARAEGIEANLTGLAEAVTEHLARASEYATVTWIGEQQFARSVDLASLASAERVESLQESVEATQRAVAELPPQYELPTASTTELGGVRAGVGVVIDAAGGLSVALGYGLAITEDEKYAMKPGLSVALGRGLGITPENTVAVAAPIIVNAGVNANGRYVVWSNGMVEQWGFVPIPAIVAAGAAGYAWLNLPVKFTTKFVAFGSLVGDNAQYFQGYASGGVSEGGEAGPGVPYYRLGYWWKATYPLGPNAGLTWYARSLTLP